jgi:hypothetical protein
VTGVQTCALPIYALSALYPKNSEEKRLLDAMLLAVPRQVREADNMYMMFVDESGDPGYPRGGNWKG